LPVTRFLFWNINRKPLAGLVAELAEIQRIDVVVLAECDTDPSTMLLSLNRSPEAGFHFPTGLSRRVTVFTRFSREFLQPAYESERITIRRVELPARMPVLLAAAHLPSKLHWSAESQAGECAELARMIDAEERKAGHRRTILVGDFNMNPFETGLVGSSVGLNAVASRQVASLETRTVQGHEYPFFYNPMWSHFGDARGETAGSYFYDAGEHVNYYWNVFDQVLLRPELAKSFDPARLRIVREIGARSLVRPDGRPDQATGSDHLPLIFEVEFFDEGSVNGCATGFLGRDRICRGSAYPRFDTARAGRSAGQENQGPG